MDKKERDVNTLIGNLQILDDRAKMTQKQSDICTELLCRSLLTQGKDVYSVWETFCQRRGREDVLGKITLCRHICEDRRLYPSLVKILSSGDGEELSAGAKKRIAYVRNKRSDKIFLDVESRIKGAKAHYSASFSDACEAVFDGKCQYCILPLENSREGKLYSFYAMMDRYELKISQVVQEDNEDGAESVTYGLLSKTVSFFGVVTGRQMLEFSVIQENADFVARVIEAVNLLGGSVADVGAQPLVYDQPRRRFYFTVNMNGVSVLPLALYMTLEYAGYVPEGLYLK